MEDYISVAEFAELSGKSETYIRRLCRENKIPYIQEQLPNSTTLKYMIDFSSPEAQKHINKKNIEPELDSETKTEQSSATVLELVKQIKDLAIKAGKVELIEDIQKREEENVKYWKEKYFEFQNNVTELNNTVTELRTELKFIKAENERLKFELTKKTGFLGLFKK